MSDLKNGFVIVIDGQFWQAIEFQHIKPGKGPVFVYTKVKDVLSGKTIDKILNAGLKIETATVNHRDTIYLYQGGTDYAFMDQSICKRINVSAETIGDVKNSMVENQGVIVSLHEDAVLFVELPVAVALEVTRIEPGLQGDRSSAGMKPTTLEIGYEIQAPLLVEKGICVRVDTYDDSCPGRVTD